MSRNYVGIDLNEEGLVCSALRKGQPEVHLAGMHQESLHAALVFSSRERNVVDPRRFVEALRRGVDLLAGREQRLALSLPDRIGRIFVTEIQTTFKSHDEGVDVLKWHLKDDLSAPPSELRLDYQLLTRREGGQRRYVVATARKEILEQYEQLVEEAGRHAVTIGFHSLLFCNYYKKRMDAGDEFLLVGLEEQNLSLQYFSGGVLAYQRVRGGSQTAETAFSELNRTMADASRQFPGMQRCPVFVHLDSSQRVAFQEMLPVLFEREVTLLDPHFERFQGGRNTGGIVLDGALVASLAAAESLM